MDADSDIPLKKRKISVSEHGDTVTPRVLSNFEGFLVQKVISENSRSKTAVIHGTLDGQDAVVLLEKKPFDASHVTNYFTEKTALNNTLKNDIYGTYDAFPPQVENGMIWKLHSFI